MWKNKPDMAKKWTDEHGSTPVKAGLGALVAGLARRVFRKKATAYADSSQAKIMGDPQGKLLDHFKNRYNQQPIQAKKGKFQEFEHPQHNITPIEHMEDKVSSKERIERLLNSRKAKKESKKKLVKAQEGQLIREKTRGVGAAIKGTDHYVMEGMDAAQEGKLIQVPTRGTGAAVKGTDHYVMQGMNAAKTGKMIKAKDSKYIQKKKWWQNPKKLEKMMTQLKGEYSLMRDSMAGKVSPTLIEKGKKLAKKKGFGWKGSKEKILEKITGDEAKGGQGFTPGWKPQLSVRTAKKGSYLTTDLKGYDVKKISKKTSEKFFDLYKHRERGGFKKAKDYKKYLTSLGKMQKAPLSGTSTTLPPKTARLLTNLKFAYKQTPKAKALSVLKAVGKRTGIGKAVAAATVVAGAYEAGKRKLFTSPGFEKKAKDWFNIDTIKDKKKKKVTKKSIGGETVILKSGGGYIDDLL